jgi:hypothetical protein
MMILVSLFCLWIVVSFCLFAVLMMMMMCYQHSVSLSLKMIYFTSSRRNNVVVVVVVTVVVLCIVFCFGFRQIFFFSYDDELACLLFLGPRLRELSEADRACVRRAF